MNCGEKSPDSGVQHLRRLTLLVQGFRSQVLVAHCPDLDVALERQRLHREAINKRGKYGTGISWPTTFVGQDVQHNGMQLTKSWV